MCGTPYRSQRISVFPAATVSRTPLKRPANDSTRDDAGACDAHHLPPGNGMTSTVVPHSCRTMRAKSATAPVVQNVSVPGCPPFCNKPADSRRRRSSRATGVAGSITSTAGPGHLLNERPQERVVRAPQHDDIAPLVDDGAHVTLHERARLFRRELALLDLIGKPGARLDDELDIGAIAREQLAHVRARQRPGRRQHAHDARARARCRGLHRRLYRDDGNRKARAQRLDRNRRRRVARNHDSL